MGFARAQWHLGAEWKRLLWEREWAEEGVRASTNVFLTGFCRLILTARCRGDCLGRTAASSCYTACEFQGKIVLITRKARGGASGEEADRGAAGEGEGEGGVG